MARRNRIASRRNRIASRFLSQRADLASSARWLAQDSGRAEV
jgi:hypothetical protein